MSLCIEAMPGQVRVLSVYWRLDSRASDDRFACSFLVVKLSWRVRAQASQHCCHAMFMRARGIAKTSSIVYIAKCAKMSASFNPLASNLSSNRETNNVLLYQPTLGCIVRCLQTRRQFASVVYQLNRHLAKQVADQNNDRGAIRQAQATCICKHLMFCDNSWVRLV